MVKKYIIQRSKQKQNINIKIHVGDKTKKANKKYRRKQAEKDETQVPLGGISSYNSYVQPYNPVYIQSGYPDNGLNAGALGNNKNMNALLELAIKGINNKPIEYYNSPLTREHDEGLKNDTLRNTGGKDVSNAWTPFKKEFDEIPTAPFSSKTPYLDTLETYKQEKDEDEMTFGHNDAYHKYLAEEAQKKKKEKLNNSRRYVLDDDVDTLLANRGYVQRSAEKAKEKKLKKKEYDRQRYQRNKNKKKNEIKDDDDEYNAEDEN